MNYVNTRNYETTQREYQRNIANIKRKSKKSRRD